MADKSQKTEKPTAKRKRDARKKGQVAKSPDVAGWLVMLAVVIALPSYAHFAGSHLTALWAKVSDGAGAPNTRRALDELRAGLGTFAIVVAPFLALAMVIALIANVAQVRFLFAIEKLKPDLSRLNPIEGVKRMFSARGLWEMGKQALKLVLVTVVAIKFLEGLARTVAGARPVAIGMVVAYAGQASLGFIRDMAIIGLVLAFADYLYQRHSTEKSLMMTKKEVKDEMRQEVGDPIVKREIRRRALRMTRLRMMAEVAKADVVITNPTHVAVALAYDSKEDLAPRVLAKGVDELAQRIREEALAHDIPILEDPPLARALEASCEIGEQIPRELYVAVARVLAFVYQLSPLAKSTKQVHKRRASALVA